MIIRSHQNLIDHFRSNPSYGYLFFDTTPNGVMSLTVKNDWQTISSTATDHDVHTMLWSVKNATNHVTSASIARTIEILTAANEIARTTRRGVGNMVICNSKTKATFDLSKLPTFTIVTDEAVTNDVVFVLYHGTGGFFAAVDGPFSFDGSTFKVRLDWANFIQRINF